MRTEPNPFASPQPTLTTRRLVLRPFAPADAAAVQRLAGDRQIAATTRNIPHPYAPGVAEQWIATHAGEFAEGKTAAFAVVPTTEGVLVGDTGLRIHRDDDHAELGYWVGVPYWGNGYATEAAAAVLDYGFRVLQLHRIFATYLKVNVASGRVMQKLGMRYEGCARHDILKWGEFHDLIKYGILASEWSDAEPGDVV